MSGARIVLGDAAALSALSRIMALGSSPEEPLSLIGEALVNSTKERIRDAKAPDGTPWAPLNPLYARTKTGTGILRETGQLLREIIYQVEGGELAVGTNRAHARVHQFGARIKPKNAAALVFMLGGKKVFAKSVKVPARPFLGVSPSDADEILTIFKEYLAPD